MNSDNHVDTVQKWCTLMEGTGDNTDLKVKLRRILTDALDRMDNEPYDGVPINRGLK